MVLAWLSFRPNQLDIVDRPGASYVDLDAWDSPLNCPVEVEDVHPELSVVRHMPGPGESALER